MKIKMLMAFVALLFSAFTADRTITIFMIGDSTMANKPLEGGNQERGWGHVLGGYFSENIRVENHARNGRSSKSFIDEGLWEVVINKVKPGDYVFIQFGHNDEKADEKRHTDPGSTFDANLRRFVKETRAKGGIPVLFNAIVRRNFRNNKDCLIEWVVELHLDNNSLNPGVLLHHSKVDALTLKLERLSSRFKY
jgi:pectinesterase